MRVKLEINIKGHAPIGPPISWTESLPFVRNKRGGLIHRVRSINEYSMTGRRNHIGITYWCNGGSNGLEKFTFLSKPSDDEVVCKRCEEEAMRLLGISSEYLAGKHVHIGGLKAIKECCEEL